MEPTFRDGDKLLLNSLAFSLRVGDIVVFRDGTRDYVKRITAVTKNNRSSYVVGGDNSGHTAHFTITRNQVKGKFLMKY